MFIFGKGGNLSAEQINLNKAMSNRLNSEEAQTHNIEGISHDIKILNGKAYVNRDALTSHKLFSEKFAKEAAGVTLLSGAVVATLFLATGDASLISNIPEQGKTAMLAASGAVIGFTISGSIMMLSEAGKGFYSLVKGLGNGIEKLKTGTEYIEFPVEHHRFKDIPKELMDELKDKLSVTSLTRAGFEVAKDAGLALSVSQIILE